MIEIKFKDGKTLKVKHYYFDTHNNVRYFTDCKLREKIVIQCHFLSGIEDDEKYYFTGIMHIVPLSDIKEIIDPNIEHIPFTKEDYTKLTI